MTRVTRLCNAEYIKLCNSHCGGKGAHMDIIVGYKYMYIWVLWFEYDICLSEYCVELIEVN